MESFNIFIIFCVSFILQLKSHVGAYRSSYRVELLVIADESLVKFHGRSVAEKYILTQFNIVNSAFHHASLGAELDIVVSRLHYIRDHTADNIIVERDGIRTLKNFCKWASVQRSKQGNREYEPFTAHDAALLLTRREIGPAGYAPVSGMCDLRRSCTVVRDEGMTSAFVIAHEIGHLLGLNHDGVANGCSRTLPTIMNANVRAVYGRYYWSSCSRRTLKHKLSKFTCLKSDSPNPKWPPNNEPIGSLWSLNEQCRQEFGHGFQLCSTFPGIDPCKVLWCSFVNFPVFCRTKRGIALPGTSCAKDKMCIREQCRPKHEHIPTEVTWSTWSAWSHCSKTCGLGVRIRNRRCINSGFSFGNKNCDGESKLFKLCKHKICDKFADVRERQCASKNKQLFIRNLRHVWLPHPNLKRPCELMCRSLHHNDLVRLQGEFVPDGTQCFYNTSTDICVQGDCKKVGCDEVWNSTVTVDKCGVCGGKGDTCITIKGETRTAYAFNKEKHRLLRIPKGARYINITKMNGTQSYVVIHPADSANAIISGRKKNDLKQIIWKGVQFDLSLNEDNTTRLGAIGPLNYPIDVYINIPVSSSKLTTVLYDFLINKFDEQKQEHTIFKTIKVPKFRFVWKSRGWTKCSRSCDGGVKYEYFYCKDRLREIPVNSNSCNLRVANGPNKKKCASIPCTLLNYRWSASKWSKCSLTCNGTNMGASIVTHGYQTRQIRCVKRENRQEIVAEPTMCPRSFMPLYYRRCKPTHDCP